MPPTPEWIDVPLFDIPDMQQLVRALEGAQTGDERLRALVALSRRVHLSTRQEARRMAASGRTWAEIGAALGVSKQSAWQTYR